MVEMQSVVTIKSKLTGLKLVFKQHLKSAKIRRGYKNITQTATVLLPRFNKLLDPGEPNYKIRVGDEITIELGYDGKFNREFEGYIVQIKSTVPLELMCEDEMWINKQISVNKAWKSVTMKELVTYLVPGTDTELVPDVTFAPFRIENTNVANALDKLKEYGVVIYYRNKKLFVGFPYYDANVDTVNFLLDYDQDKKVLPNAKAEGLEFRRAEDYKLKIRAVSILRDNSKLEVTVGDDGGDTITHHYSNIGSLSELTQMANEALKRMKVDGMTGNFKTIGGFPFCDHGWTCSIRSVRYPERNGKYFIEQVTTSYDSNGYKRDITPGRRAS